LAPEATLAEFRLDAGGDAALDERGMKRRRALPPRVVTVDCNAWQYEDAAQSRRDPLTGPHLRSRPRCLAGVDYDAFEYAWRNHRADLILELRLPTLVAVRSLPQN
jgi:hypothetical protein